MFAARRAHRPGTGSIPALLDGGGGRPRRLAARRRSTDRARASARPTLARERAPAGPRRPRSAQSARRRSSRASARCSAQTELLEQFAAGDVLPQALQRALRLAAAGQGRSARSCRTATATCCSAVEAASAGRPPETFTVHLLARRLHARSRGRSMLEFERVQLRAVAGQKMDVDVRLHGASCSTGPLSFVETLRELIPFDGFSDPPDVAGHAGGDHRRLHVGLPNIVGRRLQPREPEPRRRASTVPFVGKPRQHLVPVLRAREPGAADRQPVRRRLLLRPHRRRRRACRSSRARSSSARRARSTSASRPGSVSAMAGLYFKIEGAGLHARRLLPPARRGRGARDRLGLDRAVPRDALRVARAASASAPRRSASRST